MSAVANEWKRTDLESITEQIDYGHTASACERQIGPKFLRITDIQNGHVDWNTVPYCAATAQEVDKYRLRAGDIVFARTGATTGKSFLIEHCPKDAVFASYLIRIRPKALVDPRYLAYFFDTPDYWTQIKRHTKGAGQPGVNASNLKSLSVRLPSLSEQKRIADILDKADAIRRKRHDAAVALTRLTRLHIDDRMSDWFGPKAEGCHVHVSDFVEQFQGGLNVATPESPTPETRHFILKVSAVTWGDYRPGESKPLPADYLPASEHFVRRGDLLLYLFTGLGGIDLALRCGCAACCAASWMRPSESWMPKSLV